MRGYHNLFALYLLVTGLKPTYGLVPYTGVMPIEGSVDHVGPMARTVKDCALLLEVSERCCIFYPASYAVKS